MSIRGERRKEGGRGRGGRDVGETGREEGRKWKREAENGVEGGKAEGRERQWREGARQGRTA